MSASAQAMLSVQEIHWYGEKTEFWTKKTPCMTLRTMNGIFFLHILNQGTAF